jgi:hypothetical protein
MLVYIANVGLVSEEAFSLFSKAKEEVLNKKPTKKGS